MKKQVGRPKSKTQRKSINTKLDIQVIEILKNTSEETGIPQNRLIENAVREKYGKPKNNSQE